MVAGGTAKRTRRLSICQPTLCGESLKVDAAIAQAAGVDAIAVFEIRLDGADMNDVRTTLAQAGVSPSTYVYFGRTVDHADDPAALAEGRARIIEAATLGAEGLLVVSGPLGDRSVAEADRLCRRWFKEMAPVAADHDVRLLFEALHPVRRSFTYIHRLAHAAEIIEGIDNAYLVADIGHLWWDVSLLSDFQSNLAAIGLVQFTNVDSEALEEGRLDRTGVDGDVRLAELLQAFDAAGYSGYYEFEGRASLSGDDRIRYVASVREWFENVWR